MTFSSFGVLCFGEIPSEYSRAVENPFKSLLDNAGAQITYLIELYPFDTTKTRFIDSPTPFGSTAFGEFGVTVYGDVLPVYLSNFGYTTRPDSELPNRHFKARVDNPMQFDVSIISGNEFVGSAPSFGSVVIMNGDGELDGLAEYFWSGRRIVIKAGDKGFKYENFTTVFDGSINGLESDEDRITLTIQDNRSKTEQLLMQGSYAGTGGTEGGTDLANTAKPLCFGEVKNLEPVLVDPANLIYQVHDGLVNSIDAVRDRGVALTFAGTVSNITTATVSAGQYKIQLQGGYIKLGSTPDGRITADVKGDAGNGYIDNIPDIIRRVLIERMGIHSMTMSQFENGAFNELEAELPGAVGFYVTDRVAASAVIDELINNCGAYWTFTRLGELTCGLVDVPTGSTLSIDQRDIDDPGVSLQGVVSPAWRISVGYAPVDVVQNEDELAGGTTASDRLLYGAQYRYVSSKNDVTHTQDEQSIERTFLTKLVNKADAEALLARLVRIYGSKRKIYKVPVWRMLYRVYIGDTVNLKYPRFGLNNGQNLLVVGVSEDIETGITILDLWG